MKRCPKCSRTYPTETQKFCTLDGGLLEVVAANQGETIRIDSAQLKDAVDDAPTKAISRELISESGQFDPFKTAVARPEETGAVRGRDTRTLASSTPQTSAQLPQATPPPQTSGSLPASDSGTLPSLPSAPLAPRTPAAPPAQASGSGQVATSAPLPPTQYAATSPAPQSQPLAGTRPAKKSRLPLVLGILAVLFVLGLGAVVAAYFFVWPMVARRATVTRLEPTPQPSIESTPKSEATPNDIGTTTLEPPAYSPPANAIEFVNSNANLDGKLAEHYVKFSFYYPNNWQKDATAGVPGAKNFAKIERRLALNFPQEIFAVGWYASTGSNAADRASYPRLAEQRSSQFEKEYPEYRKISEGETKAGVYDGYEFRFESMSRNTDKGDIKIWGRVIFVPPIDGSKNGVTLLMLATSLAPELESVNDVGVKGQLPMMLESFRFGNK